MRNHLKHLAVGLVLIMAVSAPLIIQNRTVSADPAPLQQVENTQNTDTTNNIQCQDATQNGINNCLSQNSFVKDLNDIVNFLSAGVGVIVVANLIIGGIQYSMAGEGSEGVKKAKDRIVNSLIALVTFILIYAFLQWLIPGGVFS